MSKEQEIVLWMNIIMTEIRKRFNMSRAEFVPMMKKYGLISFLLNHYELLHYYDNDYIVNDSINFMAEQGGEIVGIQ